VCRNFFLGLDGSWDSIVTVGLVSGLGFRRMYSRMRPEMMQRSKNVPPAAIPAIAGILSIGWDVADPASAVDLRPVEVEVEE
jgi:hypothetical protein